MSIIKGVVLEKQNSFAFILTADGQFKKIVVQGNFEVGEEVQGREFAPRKRLYQRIIGGVAIAAALLLAILTPGFLNEDKNSPNAIIAASDKVENGVVAYVKVDINPSLQLGLDENSTVKEAIPLNADGEQLLNQGDITDMNVSIAMGVVTEWCYKLGYINENKYNVVNLTYISKEKNSNKIDKDKLEQEIRVKVEKVMENKKIKGEVKKIKELKEEKKAQKANQNKEENQQKSEIKQNKVYEPKGMKKIEIDKSTNEETSILKDISVTKDKFKKKTKEVRDIGTKKNNGTDNKKEKVIETMKKSNDKDKSEDNDKSKEKAKIKDNDKSNENSGNELGLRNPWYKIFIIS